MHDLLQACPIAYIFQVLAHGCIPIREFEPTFVVDVGVTEHEGSHMARLVKLKFVLKMLKLVLVLLGWTVPCPKKYWANLCV